VKTTWPAIDDSTLKLCIEKNNFYISEQNHKNLNSKAENNYYSMYGDWFDQLFLKLKTK